MVSVLSFIFVVGVIILFHELGHFLIAKRAGVRVETFSVGFGPALASFRRGETLYKVSAVPLGGYVRMAGEEPDGEEDDAPWRFHNKRVSVRGAVILAGPAANMLLAFLVYTGIFGFFGIEKIDSTRIGQVVEGSRAARAGLRVGDRIVEVAGSTVADWGTFVERVADAGPGEVALALSRNGTRVALRLPAASAEPLGVLPDLDARIGEVLLGGPADAAGLLRGDRIVAIDGEPVAWWSDLREKIATRPGEALAVRFERGGALLEREIVTEPVEETGADGEPHTVGKLQIGQYFERKRIGLAASVREGAGQTVWMARSTLAVLEALVTLRASRDMVGGPVSIFQLSGESARRGWETLFSLIAGLSVGLGIVNLLPIPVLDGGQLVFLGVESIRRKPVPIELRGTLQQIGLIVIILLMATVTVFDVGRLFR